MLIHEKKSDMSEQECLRDLYLSLTEQVSPEMDGHDEDWETVGDEMIE